MVFEILLGILLVQLFVALIVLAFLVFSVISLINGAPFVPTTRKKFQKILEFARAVPGEKMADLGSGDGRMVIAFAKAGVECHGYEINLLLVLYSRMLILKAGVNGKAHIHWKSFWGEDLSDCDIIMVYGISHIMKRLADKLQAELKPGARVISNCFPLPSWPYSKHEDGVYLYEKNKA